MKVYYLDQEYEKGKHKILHAILDIYSFQFQHSINVPYSILEIDEVDPENKIICNDLIRTQSKVDINGQSKYYIDNAGNLYEVENWEEYIEDVEL